MTVVEHRIVQSFNLTPDMEISERTELERRLRMIKTEINTELAWRGLAIMDLAYHPKKNTYHYSVPASYKPEDYPVIKAVVEKHCGD